jgi:hypothetical protein
VIALLACRGQHRHVVGNEHALRRHWRQRAQHAVQHRLHTEYLDRHTLELDERGHLRMAREQCTELGERRDRVLRELVAEALELEHMKGLEFLARVAVDHALGATQPVQGAVVEQHRHPVGAQLHVHLDIARAGADRRFDADQRVLGIVQWIAAVGDQFRDVHLEALLLNYARPLYHFGDAVESRRWMPPGGSCYA